jgi:hypothetical protein
MTEEMTSSITRHSDDEQTMTEETIPSPTALALGAPALIGQPLLLMRPA